MATRMAIRVAVVVAVLLMQCCNVVLAARLLEGDGGWAGWLKGQDGAGGAVLVMQLLPKGTPGGPGQSNGCSHNPLHQPGGQCH